MAIKPKCNFCGAELKAFGALLFGPPDKNDYARKTHLCRKCYRKILAKR